ncbi:MAG: hypothetical protein ACLR6I_13680 [Waltera sp.]
MKWQKKENRQISGQVCFYALYFGADRIWLSTERYMQFADCFVNYEERTKTVYHEDETTTQETYTVVIPITEKTEIFQKLAQNYGRTATYEQQSNAMNIWYIARYDRQAPMEGDEFSGWESWNAAGNIQTYDLAMNETAGEIVRLAMSRLGILTHRNFEVRENMWTAVI